MQTLDTKLTYNDIKAINIPVKISQFEGLSGAFRSIATTVATEILDDKVSLEEEPKFEKRGFYFFQGSGSIKVIVPIEKLTGVDIYIAFSTQNKSRTSIHSKPLHFLLLSLIL